MATKDILFVSFLLTVFVWTAESISIDNRTLCEPGDVAPSTRVNTTARLAAFRAAMANVKFSNRAVKAFIVGSADAHSSEYPTAHDQRRGYISGFEGSAGTAVITDDKAALWVDGRYHLEADEVLNCEWILMKQGLSSTPTVEEWINSEMLIDAELIGVDETLISHTYFTDMKEKLVALSRRPDLRAAAHAINPVDVAWGAEQPAQPTNAVNVLDTTFAGKSWQDKIADLRAELTKKDAVAYAVTSLDETAWLFNLRGSDIAYNPFFVSYAIVETNKISLYILSKDTRLPASPTDSESNETLASHLATSDTGLCTGSGLCVEVKDYDQNQVESDLSGLANNGRVWISYQANYAIYEVIATNRLVKKSPIALTKSQKNSEERTGMQNAYNRDSVALIKFLAYLEKQIKDGESWTEVSAAAELDKRRKELTYNRGLSFETISAYGSNGAIIHYRPGNNTNKEISTDSLYLLDSGGQYLDGTTDVTRTMHYGSPTAYQRECYSRVLGSAINLALLRWPHGLYGRQIDAIARQELWDAGFVYRHGTGHGIGAYLSVHEGPGRISLTSKPTDSDEPLSPYQYFSDEPGYYEDNSFGIRLETIVMVNPYTPKYSTAGEDFYNFVAVTLVPFEKNLIDYTRMTSKQVGWLNEYNSNIRKNILPLLAGDQLAIDWVNARTEQISLEMTCQGADAIRPAAIILISTLFTLFTALRT